MNCERFEQLLPLYASDDLDAAAVKRTKAHLASCADCARVADEYKGVPQWVRLHTAPEFSDDFFDGIRRNVLREIETETATHGLAHTISLFFSRPTLAFASMAAVIVTSALVLSLYLGSSQAPERLQATDASRPQVADGVTTTDRTEASLSLAKSVAAPDAFRPAPDRVSSPSRVSKVERKSVRSRAKTPAATPSDIAFKRDSGRSPAAASTADRTSRAEVAGVAPTAQQTLTIEMQTRDPNVRIIWLVSQPTAQTR